MDSFSPYSSPIPPSSYPFFSVVFGTIGLLFLAWFFVYEATSSNEKGAKYPRKLIHELFIAAPASVFLGLASLFILLWTGVYV